MFLRVRVPAHPVVVVVNELALFNMLHPVIVTVLIVVLQ